jgi:hypothetical protein
VLRNQDESKVIRLVNDPLDPSYQNFQDMLLALVNAGLKTEKRANKIPISSQMTASEFNIYSKSWGDAIINNISNGTFLVDKTVSGGSTKFQLVKLDVDSFICLNKYSAKALLGGLLNESTYCAKSEKSDSDTLDTSTAADVMRITKGAKNMDLTINVRSVGNVFDFLGSVMLAQEKDPSKTLMIKPLNSGLSNYYVGYQTPSPLFRVYKDNRDIKMSTSVTYKGSTYSIAENDDSYSKVVMEYLSTLLTITKVPGSIPPSPAILVR